MNERGDRVRARVCGVIAGLGGMLAAGEAQAEWSTQTLGGTSVEVYAPGASSPVGSGRALMLVLHGCTQQNTVLRDEGNLELAADSMGVVMAVPAVPGGGVVAGCWDYYGGLHTRTSGHNGAVLQMVDALLADPALDVDPDQVYVLGFSSGGGQAIVLGCVAPDVFAGVAVVAGPALGTGISDIASVNTTAQQAATLCTQLAGPEASALQSQAALTFSDAMDFTVSTGYNAVNAGMFGAVLSDGLDAMEVADIDFGALPGAVTPAGTGSTWADASGIRVAQLNSTSGIGHAFPSGSGMSGALLSYVNGNGLNMSQYAAEFFAAYNPRAGGWDPGGDDSGGETSDSGTTGGDAETGELPDDTSGEGGEGDSGLVTVGEAGDAGGSGAEQEPTGPGPGGCAVPADRGPQGALLGLLVFGLRRRRR